MAQAGLSILNPLAAPAGGSDLNPLVNRAPPMVSGLDALQQSMASIAATGEAARAQVRIPTMTPPPAQQASGPTIAFSPSRGEFFVQGRTFSKDDAQSAVESEALLGQPGTALPAGDWVPVDPQAYAGYLQGIKEPGLGTLFSKGFGRGVDAMQLLAGRGLQLLGAEETGAGIVQRQAEELRQTEPYTRQFTDIESGGDAVEWFVANLGEQGPNLLESIAVAAAGAAAGTATGGPGLGTLGGAIAGLAGKSQFKAAVLAAARKKIAGQALNAAENKLLRSAAGIAGATVASYANNIATGASDIYGELREQGADADDVNARMTALMGSLPYAALETLPEFLLAGRVLGGVAAPRAMAAGTSLPRRGAELLRRGAVGGAIGGAAEGTTEAGQEALLLSLSDQDLSKPENVQRLINSFAAGAAIGAPLGGLANLKGKKPADLLGGNPEPLALPAPPKQLTDQRAGSVPAVAPLPQLTGPGNVPLLTGPDVIYGEAPPTPLLLEGPPPPGTQGELNLIGGEGVAPQFTPPPGARFTIPTETPSTEIQDVLPFESGLAPFRYGDLLTRPVGTLADNPILRALQQRQQEQLIAQQEAQAAAQRQAEFEQAQAAIPPVPGLNALQQRLAESQPFMQVAGTYLPEPEYGATPAMAAEEWRALAGRGRPKPFENFLPEIQNQWIDALNMAQAGELTRDDLKQIRTELVRAENDARLGNPVRIVVTGAITPTPTPPTGGKPSGLKKPKAAKVPTAQQPATRGEALKRPVGRAVAAAPGKPVAKPAVEAKAAAASVQEEPRKAVQVLKKGEEKRKPKTQAPTLAEDRSNMTDADRIDAAIRFVEEATTRADRRDVQDAYYDILELAFFERLSSGTVEGRKAIQTKAREFLNQPVSKWHQPSLAKAFRDIILREDVLPADGPWFQYMLDNDLAGAFPAEAKSKVTKIDKIKDDALRAQAEEMFAVEPQPAVTKKATFVTKPVVAETPLSKLQAILNSNVAVFNLERPFVFRSEAYTNLPFALEDLYAEVNEADRDALTNGYPLRDYFNENGEAKFETRPDGLSTPSAKKEDEGRFALASFNQPDRADSAVGKLRMAISRFVSKLATKPKVSVFKNQADMKAKNPALYRKAVASRPEGDFDTALAAGFSFGDGNVIIFTDRIANQQHLNFVLAHETIGHFGLRGIIPANKFNATMEAIYKASPAIRSDVDSAVANGQSKAEAVEEYLSDFAAVLDTSVVARVWNAIKGALNKLGIKFGDEMVRYVLKHSRAYVRSGKSSMFDTAKVFGNLQDVEYGKGYASTGRFSTVGDIYADNRTAELVRDNLANAPMNWEKAWSTIKGIAGNNTDRFDRFKAEFLSLANFRSRLNPGLNRLEEILEAARDLTFSIWVSSNERNAEVFNVAVFGKYFGVTDEQTDSINKLMYAAQRFAVGKVKSLRDLKGPPLYEFKDGKLTPNQPEIDKLIKQGMVTFEQARDGFTYEVQLPDGTTREEKFVGIPGLTRESIEWRGYLSLRETVKEVELLLLRAH